MSISCVFLNKALFRLWHFKFPATLVMGQTAFSLGTMVLLRQVGAVKGEPFSFRTLRKIFPLSFMFLLKIVLDMSALALINIPMYGVLKTTTTPFTMLVDYVLTGRVSPMTVQLPVYATTIGGVIAGFGDLTYDPLGYLMALSSALATAGHVVVVGKLGEELKMDSFSLLMYNCMWSLPFSLVLMVAEGEHERLLSFEHLSEAGFMGLFGMACASAFLLNLATYTCTMLNDSLTTSVVGRAKSILQGLAGLFAFGDVQYSLQNTLGVIINCAGVAWYTAVKYRLSVEKERAVKRGKEGLLGHQGSNGHNRAHTPHVARDGSQVVLKVSAPLLACARATLSRSRAPLPCLAGRPLRTQSLSRACADQLARAAQPPRAPPPTHTRTRWPLALPPAASIRLIRTTAARRAETWRTSRRASRSAGALGTRSTAAAPPSARTATGDDCCCARYSNNSREWLALRRI